MDDWFSNLGKGQLVLDLGSGSGSFDYSDRPFTIIALDADLNLISGIRATHPRVSAINAESQKLPFKDQLFSLVICNNTMEHFPYPADTLREVGRVLTLDGMLIITVPDGYSLSDGLYRFLMEGGGHVNRFSFDQIVDLVEDTAALRPVRRQELYSSYVWLKKPSPDILPHLRKRFRRLSYLPKCVFVTMQFVLNVFCRFGDRFAGSKTSLYGWALFFRRSHEQLNHLPGRINVCRNCGAGHEAASLANLRLARFLYRCPSCRTINPYFKPRGFTI